MQLMCHVNGFCFRLCFVVRMGRRYNGPDEAAMVANIENSREFIDMDIARLFPNHINWFHVNFQGLHYHFYSSNNDNRPTRLQISLAVREVRDELFEIEHVQQDELRVFSMPDGSISARVQIFNLNIDLEGMPPVTRVYKHWLYYGWDHPQFANVLVVLNN